MFDDATEWIICWSHSWSGDAVKNRHRDPLQNRDENIWEVLLDFEQICEWKAQSLLKVPFISTWFVVLDSFNLDSVIWWQIFSNYCCQVSFLFTQWKLDISINQ